jgi:hypothetical protein
MNVLLAALELYDVPDWDGAESFSTFFPISFELTETKNDHLPR